MPLEGVKQNFRFMILEVIKQVEDTNKALRKATPELLEKIENRDDYIDNQKSVIENYCFSRIHSARSLDKRSIDMLRALNIISNNLERIGDYCVNIVGQIRHLRDPKFPERYNYDAFFKELNEALSILADALFERDISLAFRICRAEHNLDELYKSVFDRILSELKSGRNTENLVTSHLMFRYLERMGDSLLNVGEAIIFAVVGEKFKIHQYEALKDALAASGSELPASEVEFQSIWGTRSGCRIGRVQTDGKRSSRGAIFKEGNRKKLLLEKDNMEAWERIRPGLAPKILAFKDEEPSASLLVEYLSGCTLQDVVMFSTQDVVENAVFLLENTVREVWNATLKTETVPAGYVAQALKRLPDVFRLHPDFDRPSMDIGGLRLPTTQEMLSEAEAIEVQSAAPFSVFIHGDFNLNNVVYDNVSQAIHYIDLHRSKQFDYVQDATVFLVSNFRLPVMERDVRLRINWVVREFLRFSREFAAEHGDTTVEVRLALGLIRSLLTSTRFELNLKFARVMFQRGSYLLERLLAHKADVERGAKNWDAFRVPLDVLTF